ncbi:MAG: type 2 isopentenyl-diphosphate Delta-isomerase [Nitrososphaeria archaeon]
MSERVQRRKADHISICLKHDIESKAVLSGFECVHLIHNALPEIDFVEVDTSSAIFGRRLSFPLLFDSITGGSKESKSINQTIAEVAQEKALGMFLGSARAALEDPSSLETYSVARDVAPDIFLAINIGAPQLSKGLDIDKLKAFASALKADAITVHLNPLQEVIQVDGEPNFKGVYDGIKLLSKHLSVPVIVKEVGMGISKETAAKLELAGVACIDVAGLGGTNWAMVESIRSKMLGDRSKSALGNTFEAWGIPTVVSLIECVQNSKIPVIASGGVRSGIDVAKSLVLGAKYCAMALPVLKHAVKSKSSLSTYVDQLLLEFKTAMFLTGSRGVDDLKGVRYFVDSPLQDWLSR